MAVLPFWLALNPAPSSPFSPLLSVSSFTQGIGSDLDALVRRQTARMHGVGVGTKGTAVCHYPSVNLNSATNAASAEKAAFSTRDASEDPRQGLRVVIAGGGIGGLVLALALKRKGMDVNVLERDMTAIRGEGQYRGPIQIQSNALAALEAIDMDVADEVMANGCITGDRINGLVDGITGSWYVKFDTFTPAAESGLPVTRVISRMTLQEILARAVGSEVIENNSNVIDFQDDGSKVTIILEDGRKYEADLLVGADGIRSKVREKLFGLCEATYSNYTCYTGIADFIPPDIETVGYRVFLGHKQYFVSTDVGHGKMQWYAFNNEAAGGTDPPGGKKERLLKLFGCWCDGVVDLLLATPEERILRRDIYDKRPMFSWSKGRVTLLGDSAHAMQPNMGQGGCMAIEDAYQLGLELGKALEKNSNEGKLVDIPAALKSYERKRILRVGAIHGMARLAAIMATTYKPYLVVALGPLEFLTKLKIPHPGRVGGRFIMNIAMPVMLNWVLGGNSSNLEGRVPNCRLTDKASNGLKKWFKDDDALERMIDAEWYLYPSGMPLTETNMPPACPEVLHLNKKGQPTIIGSVACCEPDGVPVIITAAQVSKVHAKFVCKDGAFYLTDLENSSGTWVTDIKEKRYRLIPSLPVRIHPGNIIEFGPDKKAVFKVKLCRSLPQEVSLQETQSYVEQL